MKLAAIDIGSNSIKLVIVDAVASDSFAVLARQKESVRLGRQTLREGFLSSEAIERAAECVKQFRSMAEARGAERLFVIATAAVREASNATEFIKEVKTRTGVRVEILSGIEEARLIGLAAAHGCGAGRDASLINIDIGGGSTEISLVRDGIPLTLYSIKVGAVGLTELFLAANPPKSKELKALREEIRAALERPSRELGEESWQIATGTSGTILSIGEALNYSDDAIHLTDAAQPAGMEINFNRLEQFNERMAALNVTQRRAYPGISAQRAEIIVAGGQILEGVMRALNLKSLRTCAWALREGVIIDRLREMESESSPPVPDVSDQRLRGVHAVGRRFGYEEVHAHQVAQLAEQIFDDIVATTKLTRHQRTLLSAAALLHDVGYHIAHESHHKHTLYLIKNSELTGFSESERDVIANVARYHRGTAPKERHTEYAALGQADREVVCQLGAILRLAEALDRSHDSRVRRVRCTREGENFSLVLNSKQNCEREVAAAERRREMFEQAFNCRLSISQTSA